MLKQTLLQNIELVKYLALYAVIILGVVLLYICKKDWLEKLYKNRYLAGVILLAICVMFEISGSSIGMWKTYMQDTNVSDGVLLGESRAIRTDEWAVNTPMAFSQKFNSPSFSYYNEIVRGEKTDVFIVYGQPTWNIASIYRPFQLGYLFFGISKGLSFFWCARAIFLFLISFDMMMLITKKKKMLSFVGALLISFAPIVSWWFAINGLVEMLIAGQLAVLLLDKYMLTDSIKKRWLYLIGIAICAGTYILTFYPSWQIPIIYVVAGLAIWVMIKNWKDCKMSKKDILPIATVSICFLLSMIYVFTKSWSTVQAVLNTVYPGSRSVTGGGQIQQYLSYPINLFLGIKEEGLPSNVCEQAVFFDLFPIGLILTGIVFFRDKKKDKLLIILSVLYAFFSIWCISGFPEILAKITLLSMSQSNRTFLVVGFIQIFMLIRALSLIENPLPKKVAIPLSIVLAVWIAWVDKTNYTQYLGNLLLSILFVILVTLFYFALRYQKKWGKYLFTIEITCVLALCGGIVNPIRTGNNVIYEQEIVKKIEEIVQTEKIKETMCMTPEMLEENPFHQGLWVFEGVSFPYMNLPILAGAPTINCTNTYPDVERWKAIDTENKYEEIYNRYAHIRIDITNEPTSFELTFADAFTVNLNVNDIKKLNLKYFITPSDLTKWNNENISFEEIYTNGIYHIYNVQYKN